MIKAVVKNEKKPFRLDGAFSKTIIGFDLQHDVFCESILCLNLLQYYIINYQIIIILLKIRQYNLFMCRNLRIMKYLDNKLFIFE